MIHSISFSLCFLAAISAIHAAAPRVELLRTPNGGIQPQAAVDDAGTVHLIYYKGDPRGGDVFYARLEPGNETFSNPIQVNSQAGSAIAAGTIRGAQLALGKSGRVHVVWNGSAKTSGGDFEKAPLLYTRINDQRTAFEPERNIITYASGLDGGSSVAADPQGNVYIAWHAHAPGATRGELGRAIFVSRSQDEGNTFAREERISSESAGVCACCGMRAFADKSGAVYVLYRAAFDMTNRDQVLLVSHDGKKFEMAHAHKWQIGSCPMSSASLAEGKHGTLAAWETAGNVYFATVNPKTFKVAEPIPAPGADKRKHPVVASNANGNVLLVWTEGTGWQKGGAVAWQLYNEKLERADEGLADGVPVWGLATAAARPDGNFVVIY